MRENSVKEKQALAQIKFKFIFRAKDHQLNNVY